MTEMLTRPGAAESPTASAADNEQMRALDAHRVELTGYCYRMLGSGFEAEDAVQETMLRAWRGLEKFEGRSALRSWLYRIATNVCFDMLTSRQRRARPMDLGPCSSAGSPLDAPTVESMWIEPADDTRVLAAHGDPADVAVARDSVRLAFVAALQKLPPRQRAVLLLREVLRWQASEVAELLGASVASVNSALQRARATMDACGADGAESLAPADPEQRALLEKYVDAFTRYDLDALVELLHEDATMSMPPFPMWLRGPAEVRTFMATVGGKCAGSRIAAVNANGMPAFAQWRPTDDGSFAPWSIHVVEIRDGAIAGLNYFLDAERLFPHFRLPAHPDDLAAR